MRRHGKRSHLNGRGKRDKTWNTLLSPLSPPNPDPPEFHGYGAPSPLVVGTYTATQYLSPGFVLFVVRRPLPLSSGTDSKEKAL